MPDVVEGLPLRLSGADRKGRRGALQGLDLRFLVDREHGGGDRRVHVQGEQVTALLHQIGVGRS